MNKKVAFYTLGCKMNQYESDSLASDFINNGYEVVSFEEESDVYVINTCTVTNKSDRKSRNMINRARKKEGALVVVTGCFVDSSKDELEKATGVTYILENSKKNQIFELVNAHFNGEIVHENSLKEDIFDFHTSDKGLRTRAVVKIQDGCDSFCSYCIIPYVRGGGVSRSREDVIKNIKEALDAGFKEVVLTGINMSRYDYEGLNFIGLVKEILKIEGDWRLRISSLEPDMMDDSIVELFQDPKMMPHLHLCLQSGSESVLKEMNRVYSYQDYSRVVHKLKKTYDGFNITTDLIVGFPGESDELFFESLRAAEEMAFGHIHAFKYSRREGTRAAERKDQIDEKTKSERSETLRILSEKLKRSYRETLIGRKQRVLVETVKGVAAKGYGEHYVPVEFSQDGVKENTFVEVKITGIGEGSDPVLLAEPV